MSQKFKFCSCICLKVSSMRLVIEERAYSNFKDQKLRKFDFFENSNFTRAPTKKFQNPF